jgi:putative membrane protein
MVNEPPGTPNVLAGSAPETTGLASFRTELALDRTALAWVRTTLAMGSFGFGIVTFFRSLRQNSPSPQTARLHEGAIYFGTALIVLGILATVLAALSQHASLRQLQRGEAPKVSLWRLSSTVSWIVSIILLAGLWAVFPW